MSGRTSEHVIKMIEDTTLTYWSQDPVVQMGRCWRPQRDHAMEHTGQSYGLNDCVQMNWHGRPRPMHHVVVIVAIAAAVPCHCSCQRHHY